MTDAVMSLRALAEKSADADVLREIIGFAAQRLMELEVGGLTARPTARRTRSGWPSATGTVSQTLRPQRTTLTVVDTSSTSTHIIILLHVIFLL